MVQHERDLRDSRLAHLARRNRVLAHLQPVLDIERDKHVAGSAGGAGREFAAYDTRLLVIAALDAVAAESGLHLDGGVPREAVVDAIAREAGRCVPEHSEAQHAEVARWVLDRLLNAQAASRGFRVPFIDPADGHRRGELPVVFLYEQVASDGERVLVYADDAAINLFLVTIDRELEDAQVAADAVLKVQLETGRLGAATQTAREALYLSRAYRDRLRRLLETVRRDLRQVNWERDVEPLLDTARQHIQRRLDVEQPLREHAMRSASAGADPAVRQQAREVVQLLGEAIAVMTGLLHELLGARETFRAEQARQAFAPPAPVGTVDVEQDVLVPYAALPVKAAARAAGPLAAAFSAPRPPRVASLSRILGVLLAAPREAGEPLGEAGEDELADLEPTFTRFTEAHWQEATARLRKLNGTPQRLSALLDGLDHDSALLVALLALRAYRADGAPARAEEPLHGVVAVDDGAALEHPSLLGPDLLLYRAGVIEEADKPDEP